MKNSIGHLFCFLKKTSFCKQSRNQLLSHINDSGKLNLKNRKVSLLYCQETFVSFILVMILVTVGFPGGTSGKVPACQCRRLKRPGFDSWVGTIPWRRKWQPTLVFLPVESRGQRSLLGYSLQDCKELDMTEATQHALVTMNCILTLTDYFLQPS